ncbi:MAG: outer membrane protein assembly factor BamE [Rhodospirillaceae bacterium]
MTGSTAVKLFAVGLLISTTAACAPIVSIHGNFIEPERLQQIHEGISRKADIADVLGTPTATGTFDPNTWYYIGQRTEKVAFYPPEVVDRQVLVLQFDQTGVVRKVEKLDASAGQDVSLVERTTPTAGKDLSFLEQMMGNVGRFSNGKKDSGPGH